MPSEYRGIVARKTGEPLASRRLKSDVQAQQQLPLPEGMTGAEVAAEELRVAEQTRMQEQARAGVGEARSILEDDQQPLASRGRLDRAKEQGFDTENIFDIIWNSLKILEKVPVPPPHCYAANPDFG